MLRIAVMLVVLLVAAATARGDEPLFQNVDYRDVVRDLEQNGSRFYLAGILGSSFATVSTPGFPSANEPVFTTGGAAGLAIAWLDRTWRLEVEGRARDPLARTTTLEDGVSTSALSATGGWSTTVNMWREYLVTDGLTWYIGGGIGGGGYRFGVDQQYPVQDSTVTGVGTVGGFAWQAGGGIGWALTERITLDLGYRYFDIAGGKVTAQMSQTGFPIDTTTFNSAFSASELFFAVRIYEPFRRWR